MKSLRLIVLLTLILSSIAAAGEREPVKLSPEDKCPVCGMFVAKYPDFIAQVLFKDGSYAVFDGVKDMVKYYQNLAKYNPTKSRAEIDSIHVTDYYDLAYIDGMKAYYVVGSDVFGPMGKELIPFANEADAKEFMEDHAGRQILDWESITPDLVKGLD